MGMPESFWAYLLIFFNSAFPQNASMFPEGMTHLILPLLKCHLLKRPYFIFLLPVIDT